MAKDNRGEYLKLQTAEIIDELIDISDCNTVKLCHYLGLNEKELNQIRYGEKSPDLYTINAISELFDVSTDFLLKGNHDSNDLPPSKDKSTLLEYYLKKIRELIVETNISWLVIERFIKWWSKYKSEKNNDKLTTKTP